MASLVVLCFEVDSITIDRVGGCNSIHADAALTGEVA